MTTALVMETDSKLPSPIERLPRELMWKIMTMTHPNIPHLRLTSTDMKSCTEEFVLLQSSKMVETLKISCAPDQSDSSLSLSIGVHDRNSQAFERRLLYCMILNSEEDICESIVACLGRKVEKLSLEERFNSAILETISVLFKGIQFSSLEISVDVMTDTTAIAHQSFIKAHNVENLLMKTDNCFLSDPVKFLRFLSTVLCSLRIQQLPNNTTYFMAIHSKDWPKLILELFSRRLDKLCIINEIKNDKGFLFLTAHGADVLAEKLPYVKKKLLFQATLDYAETYSRKVNDNLVEVEDSPNGRILKVRHSSRLNEEFE